METKSHPLPSPWRTPPLLYLVSEHDVTVPSGSGIVQCLSLVTCFLHSARCLQHVVARVRILLKAESFISRTDCICLFIPQWTLGSLPLGAIMFIVQF